MAKEFKIRTKNKDVFLRVQKGHFATMHSHTNYYIDVTTQKMRLSEAKAVASELVSYYEKFGFTNEGRSDKSRHGGASWNQMRLTF